MAGNFRIFRTSSATYKIFIPGPADPKRYNQYGMKCLLNLAERYFEENSSAERWVPCKFLYRNKPKEYFEKIINRDLNFIMQTDIKRNASDVYNPMFAQLDGLYFTASVIRDSRDGQPLPFSIFGDTRFLVPVEKLIDTAGMNLYFSDFYCLSGSKSPDRHYANLIVARNESPADRFCLQSNLPLLSWTDNPFFFHNGSMFQVHNSSNYLVEICYTDPVCIPEKMREGAKLIHPIPLRGHQPTRPNHFRLFRNNSGKNTDCVKCNHFRLKKNFTHTLLRDKREPMVIQFHIHRQDFEG